MYYNCSESAPLINKSSSEHMFDTMAMEIEQLLSKVNTLVPVPCIETGTTCTTLYTSNI
jgi:hypothetical protein